MSGLEIGARMRSQRDAMGLDAPTVAELAGVPLERLLALEAGTPPSVWELNSIAGALAVDPSALRTGALDVDLRRSSARFRAPAGIDSLTPSDVRTLARVSEAARIHRFLSGLLRAPRGRVEALRNVKEIGSAPAIWRQGYSLGKLARERLAPQHTAIPSIQQLLEKHGVLVVFVNLETPAIAGASLYEAGASPAVLLNYASDRVQSRLARRAVLAHELCHLLHDSTMRQDLLTVVSRWEKDHSPGEQRANAFAPSFLAPRGWVERPHRDAPPEERVRRLARAWGLSFDGAAWHAKNLKQITPAAAESMPRETIEAGEFEADLERALPARLGLDLDVSPLGDSALGDLAIRAAEADLISAGRAAEILTFA